MTNRAKKKKKFTFTTFLGLFITYKYFKTIAKLIYPVVTY